MLIKNTWLFNFSSSYSGGGLKRLIETARWFDQQEGGIFIVNEKALEDVQCFSKKNIYFKVSPNKLRRLFQDGYYLKDILSKINPPDVYFSYGIPVFFEIGKVNWFHISNALSMETKGINIPLRTKLKMSILRKRITDSLIYTQIISGESEYSLSLSKKLNKSNNKQFFALLPNGFDANELLNIPKKVTRKKSSAITVGTYRYKQIEKAFLIYKQLKKDNARLNKFIIIGNKKDLSHALRANNEVEVMRYDIDRAEMLGLISDAEYYISASQIENSSIAALEGMILSRNIVLSDIPSHREMLNNQDFTEIVESNSMSRFLMTSYSSNHPYEGLFSWEEVTQKLYEVLDQYNNTSS